jgi:hypothetical protein
MSNMGNSKWAEKQLTEEQAIALIKSEEWRKWTPEEIVRFQLFQRRLGVPVGVFQVAMGMVLHRPVYIHEFTSSNRDQLVLEYLGEKPMPTLDEIINLLPEDKRIIIGI